MDPGVPERRIRTIFGVSFLVGTLGTLFFLAGRRCLFVGSPWSLVVPLGAVAGLAIVFASGMLSVGRQLRPILFLSGAIGTVFCLAFLPLPPLARDELTHHLAIPLLYAERGCIHEIPFAQQSYYPMLLETFYLPAVRWLPDWTARTVHWFFGLGTLGVLALGGRILDSPRAASLSVVLLLVTPVFVILAPTAYVDLGLLFYASLALLAWLEWLASGSPRWLVYSALATGFACSTKYNGLLLFLLLAATVPLASPLRDRPTRGFLAAAAFVVLALVPLCPWLLKNWAETGNPLFPLFPEWFGGRAPLRGAALDVLSRRRWIHGESWWEIAAVPLRVFLTGRDGDPARFDGSLGPLLLTAVASPKFSGRRPFARRPIWFVAGGYFVLAFFLNDLRARYLLPMLPLLVWLSARFLSRARRGVLTAAVLAAIVFLSAHVADKWRRTEPLAYLLGREDRATFVTRFVPEFPVLEYANAHLPPRSRLYLLFLGTRSYYCRKPFYYETYFSGAHLLEALRTSRTERDVLGQLRSLGITHLVAGERLLSIYLATNLDDRELELWRSFAASHLRPVVGANGVHLYEVL
ncbi:MAG: hypothetical protein KatS3mg076_1145 [Candidatus Binatia bacterium]|nr:MAG: hypothetical protein KatS3mg076_1145 [Candidatus Binatia bacterium]